MVSGLTLSMIQQSQFGITSIMKMNRDGELWDFTQVGGSVVQEKKLLRPSEPASYATSQSPRSSPLIQKVKTLALSVINDVTLRLG